jgi:hypothetical protein
MLSSIALLRISPQNVSAWRGSIFSDFHDLALIESCAISLFVYFSCMPTKTITLELDAYEKLRRAKRGGESFTEVVRRATWSDAPATVAELRNFYQQGGSGISDKYLDAVEKAASHDPIPDDPWA